MDWFKLANNDWNIYHDPERIKQFVLKGKITAEQYEEITGEPYQA
ncbi:XkdX family protein [Bacillus sp. T33-2]|nr:XkdX family protein [Bacillus sp. T33-2]PLR93184.1 XkdX family protein [Bacillus sp. T33-2]